ncbi:elongation of very long chain fatty acids protein AAEL008004-like isoform X2 [Contarinia nasturtii]|uniref:elongation of very long chain fatty acids protein AAEL008004-like isoform X2 n=1 Tax=Contarinia nasturtii TaxID=265458 RepID=UPI0012D45D1A|nr:elongation of very long chain fatty acids protein AAEL008004-like isoform X2 [Contarinia nasturtii]
MALIMRYIDSMQRYMDNAGDPRTRDWPMMSSPFPTLGICLLYAYFVKVVGPKLMENRKPFNLRYILILYNFVQVIFSAWLFYECLMGGWWGEYSFRCQPVDHSASPTATRMVHACWWYYFSKFTEFFDTFFFVLRKKNSQVSTLHVIHHGCMPMSVWFGVKFTPGGHSTFFGLLNTFVHIVMYSYYLFSALGPQFQRYLWWKKYLTALQMVQFVLIMVHAFQLLFIDCNYPRAFVWWIGLHAVMFFFLFNEFYKSTYKYHISRRALQKKLREMENEAVRNGVKQNGTTAINGVNGVNGVNSLNGVNGVNGSLDQYYDSVNHNHINNKKNIEYNDKYSYDNANGTTELINRKK